MSETAPAGFGMSATSAPFTNPGRAGTKIAATTHHPPSHKTISEWHEVSNTSILNANNCHGHAKDLIEFSKKTYEKTRNRNIEQQQIVDSAMAKKVESSRELCDILDDRIHSVSLMIQRTKASLAALQTAYNAKLEPRSLCSWRQTMRTQRAPRESCRDSVELALEEEKETILTAQDKLQDAMSSTEQFLECLNDTLRGLVHDHDIKKHALQVDEMCLRQTHSTWPSVPPDGVVPEATRTDASAPYQEYHKAAEAKRKVETQRRTEVAKERQAYAETIHKENEALIIKTGQDCADARTNVEEKIKFRIAEVQAKRREIELSVAETQEKIELMAQVRFLTDAEIKSHEEPEQILKQRMDIRKGKSSIPGEDSGDPVTTELIEQQHSLKQSKLALERRKEEEKQSLAMLVKSMADLKEDLNNKNVVLQLDMQCQKTGAQESKVVTSLLFN